MQLDGSKGRVLLFGSADQGRPRKVGRRHGAGGMRGRVLGKYIMISACQMAMSQMLLVQSHAVNALPRPCMRLSASCPLSFLRLWLRSPERSSWASCAASWRSRWGCPRAGCCRWADGWANISRGCAPVVQEQGWCEVAG